jgi:hypothetical protein
MLTVLFCFTVEVRVLSVCKLSEFQTPTEVGASGIRYPIFTGFFRLGKLILSFKYFSTIFHNELRFHIEIYVFKWDVRLFNCLKQLYRSGQFYWRRQVEYPVKSTNLPQVTDKSDHTKLDGVHLTTAGNRAHNFSGHRYSDV